MCIFAAEKLKETVILIKFAVKNFRGFAERIEWDLSQPSNYSFNTYAIKDGAIKNDAEIYQLYIFVENLVSDDSILIFNYLHHP